MFLYRTSSNVTASDENESNIDDREDVKDSEYLQSTPASSQYRYNLHQLLEQRSNQEKGIIKKATLRRKLLEIIEKSETKLGEDKMFFCLSIASTLKKIKDLQKKEYAKLQLQQCMYNSLYGQGPSSQQGNQNSMPLGMIHNSNFTFDGTNYTNY